MPGAHVQLQYNEVFSTNGFQQIGFKIDQHEPGLSSGHGTELKSPKEFKTDVQKLLLSLLGNLGNVNQNLSILNKYT